MALFTAALDGEAELQLTEWGFGARPDWSPDGEWIVLMDTNTCDCPARQDFDLHRIRPDGSGLTQLTDSGDDGTFDAYPRWLPDGSGIIFSRCTTGGLMCHTRTIAADGSSDLRRQPVPPMFAQGFPIEGRATKMEPRRPDPEPLET